jgi:hypothetical protein
VARAAEELATMARCGCGGGRRHGGVARLRRRAEARRRCLAVEEGGGMAARLRVRVDTAVMADEEENG